MSQFQPPHPPVQPGYVNPQPYYPPQLPQTPMPGYYPPAPQPPPGYPQWQQPSFPQWQQPPMMPMQPPPQPPKQPLQKYWLIIGGIALLVVVIVVAAIVGNHGSSPTASITPTAQPTQVAPTSQPTTPPTQVSSGSTLGNQVVVGATEATFTAKFGQPTSTQNGGQEVFYQVNDPNIGQFAVFLSSTSTVLGIVIAAPTGQPWNSTTAISVCTNYMPEDAKLDPPQNVTNSTGNVTGALQNGHSAELANSVDASLFTDASGNNLVSPGTFSTKYTFLDSSGTAITVCAVELGLQSTTS